MQSSSESTASLVTDRRSLARKVLWLAWPVLIQQFLILSVGLYDQFLAGNNEPKDPTLHVAYQAAQTTANYIAWFVTSCTALVSVGGTALVARFVGAKDHDGANRALNQSLFLAFVFGIIGTPLALLLLPSGVRALGLTGFSGASAIQFLQPILLLVTFQMITHAGLACLVGAGDTRTGPLVLSTVAIVNIPLAWVCFHGWGRLPGMGFFGIGVGTALSHSIGCVIVLGALVRGRYGLHLRRAHLVPQPALIMRLLRVSVPACIDTVSIGLCQFWFLAIVNELGDVAATAHGTAIRCEGLGYMSGQAFATAAATLVGQNLGAKRPQAAARCAWIALGFGCLTMSLMGVMFFTFAREMFQFFSPHEHQLAVVTTGVPVLRLVAFAMPALSLIIVLSGALRGAGDTRFPILLTWIGFLAIRIPLAYLFTRATLDLGSLGQLSAWEGGLLGAWIAMFVDLLVRGALFLWRFTSGRWQTIQV